MMLRLFSIVAYSLLLAPLMVANAHAELNLIYEKTTPEGVGYISGGIGNEEQNMLATQRYKYNLHLRVALTTGHYVSDATVVITDASGAIVIEDAMDGPYFYAKLAPGKYKVSAILFDQTKSRNVRISKTGHRAMVIRFTPSEFEDGLDQRGLE